MRILVTGATGFVGPYVVRELASAGHEVHGTGRGERQVLEAAAGYHRMDLRDARGCREVVEEVAPDACVHLAGLARPRDAGQDPARTMEVNALGTWVVARAMAEAGRPGAFVLASTAYVYDRPEEGVPLRESHPTVPQHVYGVSKLAAEALAGAALAPSATRLVILRLFNHVGPGQATGYLVPDLVARLRRLRTEAEEPAACRMGNPESARDYTDVRDVARAYRVVLEDPATRGVFNVGSGVGRTAREVLEGLAGVLGVRVRPEVDPALLRPDEVRLLVADPGALRRATGWEPRIPFETTLEDVVEAG